MSADIIDVEDGNMRIRASMDNGDAEAVESGEVTPTGAYMVQDEVIILEPCVGMEFDSESSAKAFYDEYARLEGFSTKICQTGRFRSDSALTSRQFVCTKEGLKKNSSHVCEAMLKIELKGSKWAVTKFVKGHNHPLESPDKVHSIRPHGHFAGTAKNDVEAYQAGVMVPSGVMYVTMDGNHVSQTSVEANRISPVESNRQVKSSNGINYAIKPATPRRTWGKDAQNMLDYFKKVQAENPGFFYAIQLDEDNRMANAFWADARSRTAYSHFGDAVTLDTSFRVNQYKVPFVPFTGLNHHGQTILFACALLLDDSEASFVWLLRTFVTAMSDHPPVSIVTDQDRVIQAAISQVLPKSRHCLSKWHVLREGQERLAHVCLAHPNFQVELYNCINLTETIDEFESSWDFIIDKYDLRMNDWLQSLYNARRQWVPVYFRDSFFAAVSPNQGVECSFFAGYVNQHTTLPTFFRQYERAMEYWFEKEMDADFDTISNSPVLSTPSPMEKQAADLYTKKIFSKFQDELVETFVYTANRIDSDGETSTYRVAKFEDDHKAYTVTLNISDMRASCSCLMFEYSGILCRHILTVFTVTNVLTLPPHYILKRWTRNAKGVVALDEPGADHAQESTPSRYNSLCREAARYAEVGATTSDTYAAALNGLREGAKKIAAVKKIVAKVSPQSFQKSASGYDDRKNSAADTPLLWPRQDEVTRQFNLNDSAILPHHVSGMNLLRMAPTSVQRDDGPSDNMVVLPCLKSMTWVMENKNSTPANRVAVINLKLQDYRKNPAVESEVKFQLSTVTLEPMLKSMAHISEQLSTPANRVAVINLKLQDTETISGESEVKFQVSRDTLGAMLRSMAYIREQLSVLVEPQTEQPQKKQRK
ncbi:protein FAR1-RELATED SEQUENCE 3 isoform X2 [Spinacia oleracea]|uniref:Protein FAR1-RELATED SEQUENCE n=1 Tax=Spinacia oleracea TaxID=3562 RepID=A0A9R0J1Y6_SPIOL|nr:protein FAR1-RELATED SEQUENCE 3-like isoform X2 [Spinacia oleracea]